MHSQILNISTQGRKALHTYTEGCTKNTTTLTKTEHSVHIHIPTAPVYHTYSVAPMAATHSLLPTRLSLKPCEPHF